MIKMVASILIHLKQNKEWKWKRFKSFSDQVIQRRQINKLIAEVPETNIFLKETIQILKNLHI